jgi:DNA end-binding protein Ku
MLSILRYANELRDPKPYFESINAEPDREAIGLATDLIEAESGRFEPEKLPDKYAQTLREFLQAKVEQRAPQIEVTTEGKAPEVINIMDALNRVWSRKDAPR